MGICGLGGGDHLLHGGVGMAVANVVEDAVVEEKRFLLHEGEMFSETVSLNLAKVVAVEEDLPGDWIVKAQQKIEDGAFSRAAGTAPVSYTHLRAHETGRNLVCRLL